MLGARVAAAGLKSAVVVSARSGADMVQKIGANLGVEAAADVHIKGGANVAITGAMVIINSADGSGSG